MARVDPDLAAVRGAVRSDLATLAPEPGQTVLVACSGGADSLALAAALAHEARRVGRSVRSRGYAIRAGAVVVDHGLQPGSDDVAAAAAQRCRELGLDPVLVRAADVARDGGDGLEAAARAARYAELDAAASSTGAVAVLLGHTLDDQAEQVLLGLGRGSGARSLGGMPAVRGIFRRPLLGLRRAQTERACAAQGLEWWDDPTNALGDELRGAGVTPLRTRVRHELLPVLADVLGPGAVEGLARTAGLLRADAQALDAAADELLARAAVVDEGTTGPLRHDPVAVAVAVAAAAAGAGSARRSGESGAGTLVLDVATLAAAPDAVRHRALRAAALAVGAPAGATGSRHVAALDALVVAWRGQGPVDLPSAASARRAYGRLFLNPGPAGVPFSTHPY